MNKVHDMQTNSGDRSPGISCYIFTTITLWIYIAKGQTTFPTKIAKFRNEQKLENQQIIIEYQEAEHLSTHKTNSH